ncbi:hypothetical protein AB3S75_000022 [Citrus x aurantiifolia]
MLVSLETLAMTGADYVEWGMDVEEWERDDNLTPPHLLAEEEEEEHSALPSTHFSEDEDEDDCDSINNFEATWCSSNSAGDQKDSEGRIVGEWARLIVKAIIKLLTVINCNL